MCVFLAYSVSEIGRLWEEPQFTSNTTSYMVLNINLYIYSESAMDMELSCMPFRRPDGRIEP